jgi:hypothetical protein
MGSALGAAARILRPMHSGTYTAEYPTVEISMARAIVLTLCINASMHSRHKITYRPVDPVLTRPNQHANSGTVCVTNCHSSSYETPTATGN